MSQPANEPFDVNTSYDPGTPPLQAPSADAETRPRAVLAWLIATTIAPALFTVSVALKNVPIEETVSEGQLAQIAAAVFLGALIIELKLGGADVPKLALQVTHIMGLLGAILLFSMLQKSKSGHVTTHFTQGQIITSLVLVVLAAIFSPISVYREFSASKSS